MTATHAPRSVKANSEATSIWVVLLILVGFHIGLSIAPGGVLLVPFALSGAAAALGLLTVSGQDRLKLTSILLYISAFLLLSGIIGVAMDGYPVKRLTASIQLIYSLAIGLSLFENIKNLRQQTVSRAMLTIGLILLVGSALEVYGPLRPLSDWARVHINTWRPVYWDDYRDIVEYGGIRPKFFSQEPSVLGIVLTISLVMWFLSSSLRPTIRLLALAAMGLAGYYLVKSITIFFGIGICAAYHFTYYAKFISSRTFRSYTATVLMLLVVIAIPLTALTFNNTTGGIRYTRSASFFGRQIAPLLITSAMIPERPLLGIGLGGWEAARPTMYDVYGNVGTQYNTGYQFVVSVDKSGFARIPDLRFMMTNAFWEYWLMFGLAGGMFVLLNLYRALSVLGTKTPELALAAFAVFAQTLGGIGAPGPWIMLGAIAATSTFLSVEKRDAAAQPARVSSSPLGRGQAYRSQRG
ncbi:hypothetical protein [Phenylobacterium aquaticum]|uniref:hypothetical protein n=1 Tax=Phenylobacterium aquaticum TaxID=1763816 RepID=UPI001F5D3786|nr:hypothetical protein [Phenylobacterium aquaticum]MCI3132739.1 hypothetical protein [Phenylobacterium aquaticum]